MTRRPVLRDLGVLLMVLFYLLWVVSRVAQPSHMVGLVAVICAALGIASMVLSSWTDEVRTSL